MAEPWSMAMAMAMDEAGVLVKITSAAPVAPLRRQIRLQIWRADVLIVRHFPAMGAADVELAGHNRLK